MPIYEYTCQSCEQDFELLVRGQDSPECPECGGHRLQKRLSVPAAHVSAGGSLPVCAPPAPGGGCGRPQCGSGGCMGLGF